MSRRAQQRRRGVLLLAAVLLALVCSPARAFASDVAVIIAKVRVFQTYDVSASGLQNTFEYLIEPVEENAPMPVGSDGTPFASFTLRRDEDLWLEFPVEVQADPAAAPYVYHYTMRPKQEKLSDGLYYVDVLSTSLSPGVNEYPLEIHVQPSNYDAAVSIVVPTVHAEEFDGPKVTDPGWRIGYKAPTKVPEETPANETGDNPDGKPTPTQTASTGATTSPTAGTSRASLAQTDDALVATSVLDILTFAGFLLIAFARAIRVRAGEHHA